MLRRKVQEVEFKDAELQEWICKNYPEHYYNFKDLTDKLRKDGFCIQTYEEKEEVLSTLNDMLKKGKVVVTKIFADIKVDIFDCEFHIKVAS